jgi:hypothetical protein
MKKQFLTLMLLTLTLSTMSVFQSCRRDRWTDDDSQVAADNSLASATTDDIFKMSDDAVTSGTVSLKTGDAESIGGPCATVTRDTVSSPRKITIDFGTTNCIGNDGKARRGKINISYTGRYRDPGTIITVTTDNYFVNDNEVRLTKTITNKGRNAAGQLFWNIAVVNAQLILANNGGTISWSKDETRTWVAGENTLMLRDNKYEITGSGSGINKAGTSYTVSITSPILVDFSCAASRLLKGTISFTPSGKTARVVDFGNGACDDDATITVGSTTKSFKLKK